MRNHVRAGCLSFLFLFMQAGLILSQEISPYANGSFATVDGIRIHYRVWEPTGEIRGNLLFIHGFCGSTFSWQKPAEELRNEGWRILAADLPGFGFSDRPYSCDHRATKRASLMAGLLEQVAPGNQWYVAGHSMGAETAAAMGWMYSGSVRGVILVDGFFPEGKVKVPAAASAFARFPPFRVAIDLAGRLFFFREKKIRSLLRRIYLREPAEEEVQGYLLPLKVKGTARSIMDMAAGKGSEEWPSWKQWSKPLLCIWGEKDNVIPLKAGKRFSENCTAAGWVVINGAGHCPMETHTSEFLDALRKFIMP